MFTKRVSKTVFWYLALAIIVSGCGKIGGNSGIITGKVLDKNGAPIETTDPELVMIVALFCKEDTPGAECLNEGVWDLEMEDVMNAVCEAKDKSEDCLLHYGSSAAVVGADGSYTLEKVPPGNYGLMFMFRSPSMLSLSLSHDAGVVEAGQTVKYDIQTDLSKN